VKVKFFDKNRFIQFSIFINKLDGVLWALVKQAKRRKGNRNSLKIGHFVAKLRLFHFWPLFWTPPWISEEEFKKCLKMFFRPKLNILYTERVLKWPDKWRSSQILSMKKCPIDAILIFWSPF
jgi:hypothetical protein